MSEALALSATSILRKSERIAARAVAGKAIVVVLDEHMLHTLNKVGTRVFELCDGSRDVAAIAREIARSFGVDYARAEQDVLRFLRQLVSERVVDVTTTPGGTR